MAVTPDLTTTTTLTIAVSGYDLSGNNVSTTVTLGQNVNTTLEQQNVQPLTLTANTFANLTPLMAVGTQKLTIMPPLNGTGGTLTLKGVTGDTGVRLDPTSFTTLGFDANANIQAEPLGLVSSVTTTIQIAQT
jgi:lipopolysaccharide export system protein LptC